MILRAANVITLAVVGASAFVPSVYSQERRPVEVGGFLQWTSFDNSLRIDDFFAPGGHLTVPVIGALAAQADVSRSVTNGPPTVKVTYLPIHARLVYSIPVRGPTTAAIGAGYVHNRYGASRDASDHGVSGLAGVRFRLTDRIGARFDFVADYMPSPANAGPVVGENWNLGLRQGLTFSLGRSRQRSPEAMERVAPISMAPISAAPVPAPPAPLAVAPVPGPDSDGDGVVDGRDRCPATPAGTTVDAAGCPLDTDGDGVLDRLDRCPNTTPNTIVGASGCVLDSDGDGVPDAVDRCPATPAGTRVDAAGCLLLFEENKKSLVLEGVNFANGRAELTEESKAILDNVAASLVAHGKVRVRIEGHTSSTGTRALNLRLSQARADAVRDHLAAQGVAADRLIARGFGPDWPIASNTTAEGQAKNRRVALVKLD